MGTKLLKMKEHSNGTLHYFAIINKISAQNKFTGSITKNLNISARTKS